jgi:hypothetical protein
VNSYWFGATGVAFAGSGSGVENADNGGAGGAAEPDITPTAAEPLTNSTDKASTPGQARLKIPPPANTIHLLPIARRSRAAADPDSSQLRRDLGPTLPVRHGHAIRTAYRSSCG